MLRKILPILTILLLPIFANASDIKRFQLEQPFEAPEIKFTDQQNIIHSLSDYKGKVVLLNFWATWCAPCVEEMPSLGNLAKFVEGKDIVILPVSIDAKGLAVVQQFYKDQNITNLPVYVDEKGKAFRDYKLQALPTTLVIDRKGMAVAKILGAMDWDSQSTRDYLLNVGR